MQVEFATFDGLVVRAIGAKRGEEDWVTFTARVDADQVGQILSAREPRKRPSPVPRRRTGAEPNAAICCGERAGRGPPTRRRGADPAAEAERINKRVAGWRYKIAGSSTTK